MANVTPLEPNGSDDGSLLRVWKDVLGELELTMVKTSFRHWLGDARLVAADGDHWTVGLRDGNVLDFVEHRYRRNVERMAAVAGRPVAITFVAPGCEPAHPKQNGAGPTPAVTTGPGQGGGAVTVAVNLPEPEQVQPIVGQSPEQLAPTKDGAKPQGAQKTAVVEFPADFGGFMPIDSNFTQTPGLFFDYVIPRARPVVSKLVTTVIRQTLGTFDDKRHQRRREEWPTNKSVIERMAGINSRTSLLIALWDGLEQGYIVLRPVEDPAERAALETKQGYPVDFTLRLRFADEPADYPDENRPEYGQAPQRKRGRS